MYYPLAVRNQMTRTIMRSTPSLKPSTTSQQKSSNSYMMKKFNFTTPIVLNFSARSGMTMMLIVLGILPSLRLNLSRKTFIKPSPIGFTLSMGIIASSPSIFLLLRKAVLYYMTGSGSLLQLQCLHQRMITSDSFRSTICDTYDTRACALMPNMSAYLGPVQLHYCRLH